jgi:hypothetical protein
MTPDRAAEEAAIAAFIATKGVTRVDAVDPIDRAIEQWRREKDNKTGTSNGMRAMMQARRGRPRKVTQPQAVMPAAKPKRSYKKKIVAAVLVPAAEPWFAAAMRGPEKGDEHGCYGAAAKRHQDSPIEAGIAADLSGTRERADRDVQGEPWGDRSAITRGLGPSGNSEATQSFDHHCGWPPADRVASLAYALWERDGRVHGLDVQHWLTAEAILRNTDTDTGWQERDAKASYEEAIRALGEQVKAGRPLPESFVPRTP